MATILDYSSFLPGKLEPALQSLTKVYKDNTDRLTNAYFQTPLPGVYTSAPDIIGAKNLGFRVALRSLPSIRDVIAYAELLATMVPVVSDRDALVSILLPNVSSWKILETSDLSNINEEYRQKFIDYLPVLGPIIDGLNEFLTELKNIDKAHPPAWFEQTLFDTLRPILSFAHFRSGVEGQSTLAGILGLTLTMVSTPLNKVLFPFLPFPPDPKVVIAEAIQKNLVDAITSYGQVIHDLVPLFESFQDACIAVSQEQAAVAPRIKDNAPGPEPTTADQCVATWQDVQTAGNGFINLISGGLSASAESAPKSFRLKAEITTQEDPISPGDVTKAFGPPAYTATTLPEMSATTGQIVDNFNKILTQPFIDQLKVTDMNGDEIALSTVMLTCKKKYEALQGVTVDIVRELDAYALLQTLVLPTVESPQGLTLQDFLTTNLPLVMKYGKDAKKIAEDTQALLIEFQGWLAVLTKNLEEINKSIAENKVALDEAQKEYDSMKASAILEGILAVVFTAITIAALVAGQGELAIEMGIEAGKNFIDMIRDAVTAGKLAIVIGNLQNVIATSERTRDQLNVIIPLFSTIIDLMGVIHTVWEAITGDLDSVQQDYELWKNPRYFTAASLKGALDNWDDVIIQCEKYISIVAGGGGNASVVKEFRATTQPQTKVLRLNTLSPTSEEPPPPYEIAVLPGHHAILGQELSVEDRVGLSKALVQSDDFNRLVAALSPADVVIGVNRSKLHEAANSYQWIANNIRNLYSDSANEAQDLVNVINAHLIPSLTTVIEFYIRFAAGQADPFSGGTSQEAMEALIHERSAQLTEGTKLAASSETVFINFRTKAQGSLNTLIRHMNELNQQLSAKEATLRDLEADYAKWSWVLYWPIPPGVGQIIYLIINSITKTTEEINNLRNDINKLSQAHAQVLVVQQVSDSVGQMTSTLSQSWSQLTTKTQELSTLVKAVDITPDVAQAILPVVRAKWQALSGELSRW